MLFKWMFHVKFLHIWLFDYVFDYSLRNVPLKAEQTKKWKEKEWKESLDAHSQCVIAALLSHF